MDVEQEMDTLQDVTQKVENKYSALQEKTDEIKGEIERLTSSARRRVETTWSDVSQLVRENPMASVGIAAVVGISVGVLLTAWANKD